MLKALEFTNIWQQNKVEGAWSELEAKYCFQRQSWSKYMKQALVLL